MGTARQFCLDLMKMSWMGIDGSKKSDCAIILEIERSGGLVQTTVEVPYGSEITLETGRGAVLGQVTSCDEDAFGYIVNFAVAGQASKWFPEYLPQFLHSAGGR